jgi:hydroxyacyl-ACP dehydratase HTD2-like protein with hotdog domain
VSVSDVFELVHERARSRVGVVERRVLGQVSASDFARFAVATDDLDLRYTAPGTEIAPPLYLSSVLTWGAGPEQGDLRDDGTSGQETVALSLENLRLMGGGQDLEYHREVPAGTTVVLETSIEGAELKDGRSGRLLLLHVLRRYTDETGSTLLTCRETFLAR